MLFIAPSRCCVRQHKATGPQSYIGPLIAQT